MIINKIIIIYFFLLAISLAVGLVAGGAGLSSLFHWKSHQTPERRNRVEKKLYLCMSAIFLGVCIRVVMLPIWFYMLHGLIPLVPGAMCLSGVHQSVPFYSWVASGLKLLLPFLYVTWVIIGYIDRKSKQQPFLKIRHLFLLPLVLLLIVEAFFDITFITSIKPQPVSCCTALFDMGSDTVPAIFTERHWYFVAALLSAIFFHLAFILIPKLYRFSLLLTGILSIIIFILLPLAHHTQLSPLLLETPFHHCVFCLLQNKPIILFGTILVLFGVYFSFSYALIGISAIDTAAVDTTWPFLRRIKWSAIVLLAMGLSVLAGSTGYHIINSGGIY